MRKIFVLSALIIFSCGLYAASDITPKNKKVKKAETEVVTAKKDSVSAYDKLFKAKHETASGMFILHKLKEKIYFEIPLKMLGKEMLLASTTTETSDNANGIVGGKTDPIHIVFTKSAENVQLRRINCDVITDNMNSNIAKAIQKSNIGSIMKSMKIEAYSKDSTSVVIDMTSFFVGDNKDLSPFDKYSQYTMFNGFTRTDNFQQEKSYPGNIKAFSDNITITSTLSYNYTLIDPKTNKSVVKDEPFTVVATRSVVLLKDEPIRPRLADYRVAVFNTGKYLFGEKEQSSRTIYYANRWNLEPKDPQAFKAGKPVEPKTPIVFYIDSNFPEKWKPFIKESVEQWNELFEQIGFKNAIKAIPFPSDDPEFDPDNIKYSCIRYAPIGIQNAMGPSWVDPRSGEIINASVYVYHDIIKLLNNWMFVQISPANKRLQTKDVPEDILMDGIRYVVSHEIGHCLGFMHNMSASNVIPVDSLRSATFTNKTGTTTSIMDYARFNYVAQPGDMEKGVKLTPPRFGAYDKFLIKWNYSIYSDTKTPEEEAVILSKMVSDSIKKPIYRYGIQLSSPLDPRSQTEDLGDDALKASEYGIKNLKYIMANLDTWVGKDDDDFSYRSEIYDGIVYQYIRYINHIFASVGGIYLNEVKVVDNMVPFKSVEKEKQRASLKFIMNQIKNLDWFENDALTRNLTIMGSAKDLLGTVLAKAVIASPAKVMLSASVSADPYDFTECSNDVFDYVWKPSINKQKLTPIEKFMQTEYLNGILSSGNVSKLMSGSGISNFNLFDILRDEDTQSRFLKQNLTQSALESVPQSDFSPNSASGVPSTKFSIVFNTESNFYTYVIKTKRLLESLKNANVSQEDKLHYDLLLKKINSSLKVQ